MKKQNDNFTGGIIELFRIAIITCGLILGLTVLCGTVAFAIFKFILFIGDMI